MAKFKVATDPRGGHVRIYWDMLDSHAWHALSWADQGLYVALRRKLLRTNNGNIAATLSTLRHAGVTSSASLAKSLRALIAVGLLDKTRQGGVASGGKMCSLYRFTDVPILEHPKLGFKAMRATNEWNRFASHREAKEVLRLAHEDALRPATREKRKLHKLNRVSSPSEGVGEVIGSIPEQVDSAVVQLLNKCSTLHLHLEPA